MPTNPLLEKLAQLYSQADIDHPQLKEVTLAQWMLESGRATSDLAKVHFNFGGLKFRPELSSHATKISFEAHDGVDFYCKFATLESFIKGYWAFINRAPYNGWKDHAASGEDYIKFIGPIYTPTAGYADKVLQLVPEAKALLESAGSGDPIPIPTGASLGTIVIDPGHGGDADLGGSKANNATSLSGVKEKKLTLDFCLNLRDSLEKEAAAKGKPIKVVLTRTVDKNVGIRDRAKFAKTHEADLFLCLHFNGHENKTIRGVETFFRDQNNLNRNEDIDFANKVNKSLFDSLKAIGPGATNRGVKPDTLSGPGSLVVIKDEHLGNQNGHVKCRACYVELEFITNPKVDELLVSGPNAEQNRGVVMGNLAKTMVEYLESF
jgi:N-acetylmuramoyl-L-alanine amidase